MTFIVRVMNSGAAMRCRIGLHDRAGRGKGGMTGHGAPVVRVMAAWQ